MNFRKFFRILGPGVTTGISDDDPSGIATYSQAGAQFGFRQLWVTLYLLPFLIAIQESCARVGIVTGRGLAGVIRENYSRGILYPIVLLLFFANVINIGADLGAIGAAFQLIIPINMAFLLIFFSLVIILLAIFLTYNIYSKFLIWLCIFIFAYPITLFIIKLDWIHVLKSSIVPHIEFNFQFLYILIAVFGTTISPYLFFWQSSEEVEEKKSAHLAYKELKNFIYKMRLDNLIGMLFCEIGAWSIIVVTASVLHGKGIFDIKTSADAAKALEPFVDTFSNSGYLAKVLFGVGIIGLGFLAVPILAGSAAYAFGEAFKFKTGLDNKFKEAPTFYGIIILSTLIGLLINLIGIDPVKGLIYSAVINGVISVPLILMVAIISRSKKIMGKYRSGVLSTTLLWLTFLLMSTASIFLFITSSFKF